MIFHLKPTLLFLERDDTGLKLLHFSSGSSSHDIFLEWYGMVLVLVPTHQTTCRCCSGSSGSSLIDDDPSASYHTHMNLMHACMILTGVAGSAAATTGCDLHLGLAALV